MEPYELSLRQVNLEEKDIKEGDTLDSFENLYCFDEDFKQGSQGLPVIAKRVFGLGKSKKKPAAGSGPQFNKQAYLIDQIHESKKEYYTHGQGRAEHAVNYYTQNKEDRHRHTSPGTPSELLHQNHSSPGHSGGDSFRSFTQTVDALALQSSVIGKSKISPASPEDVAKVIAETQRRLLAVADTSIGEEKESLPEPPGSPEHHAHKPLVTHHNHFPKPNFTMDEADDSLLIAMTKDGDYDISMTNSSSGYTEHMIMQESITTTSTMVMEQTSDVTTVKTTTENGVQEESYTESTSNMETDTQSSISVVNGLPNGSDPLVNNGVTELDLGGDSSSGTKQKQHSRNTSDTSSTTTTASTAEQQPLTSPHGDSHGKPLIRIPKENITVEKSSSWFYTRGSKACSHPNISKVSPEKESISTDDMDHEVIETTAEVHPVPESPKSHQLNEENAASVNNSNNIEDENSSDIPEVNAFNEFCKNENETKLQSNSKTDTSQTVSNEIHSEMVVKETVVMLSPLEAGSEEEKRNDGSPHEKGVDGPKTEHSSPLQGVNAAVIQEQNKAVADATLKREQSLSPGDRGSDNTFSPPHTETSSFSGSYSVSRESSNSPRNVHGLAEGSGGKQYVDVDITDSPKNVEKRVKELELEMEGDGIGINTRSKDYKKLRKELERLMRARAKLEGQLEVMQIEAKDSLQQRSDLQTHVAALKQQMKSHETSVKAAMGERDAVSYDMLTLKQNKSRLEQVIMDSHKLMTDKDEDLKTLNEDLQLAQKANETLQEKLKDLKREMQSKDTTVQDLKNKITELYVQFQTTNQTKILLENEIRSLKSEIKTLSTAKEWYQQQLQQAQESKNKLQQEITNIKGEVITKTTVIERLKAENVRIKQQITDSQQRVIQEKQLLAQHLEAIEADMLEREATFTRISQERDAYEKILKSRGESPEAALREMSTNLGSGNPKVESGENVMSDLDLRRLGNDVRRKQAQISVLEHEHAELMKRLALSQESILDRDRTIDGLEKKYVDVEVNLKQVQHNLGRTEEDLIKTQQEKGLVESELAAVKAEKKSFDDVIQNLKENMTKVERSFRHIKHELAQKNEELTQLKVNKDRRNEVIASSTDKNTTAETHQTGSYPHKQQEVTQQNFNEDLHNMKSQNNFLEKELKRIRDETSSKIQDLLSQKVLLENKLSTLEARERNSPERKAEIKTLVQNTIHEVEKSKEVLIEHFRSHHVEINKETLVREYVKVGENSAEVNSVIEENNKLKMVVLQMMNNMKGVIDGKLEGLKSELDKEKHDKTALELQLQQKSLKEHGHLAVRIKELEREVQMLRDNEARSDQEAAMELSLELEKEKGKLAAVQQNYEQLKLHASGLESQMAQHESSNVAWSSHTQHEMRGREKVIADLKENIRTLEAAAVKDKHMVKEVKKQLLSEKGGHIKTRRKFEALWVDHDQMRVDYENKIKELENTLLSLEKTKESEAKFRESCEKLNAEYQNMKVDMEELRFKVGEREAKDPVVGEHIKSLEWQLKEKEQEVFATKQQITLVEDRQLIEVENMRKTIQGNTSELSKLREDLSIVKKEKTSLQGRNTELKNALQATVQANKHGKAASVDFTAIEKLLQETGKVSNQSKPLSFLQATLTDLRGEISTLQTQMDTHATAIQSSSQAWRELEQQVADIREVCKSTAADREASKELLSSSTTAKAAAQSPIAMATQAIARSTTLSNAGTTFIPPLPSVKLADNMDFSLPPMIDDAIIKTNSDKANNASSTSSASSAKVAIDKSVSSTSKTFVKAGSEERRITTRTLIPNSVYSPPNASK